MNESIELRHLRYFLAVAETENFTRAAERLGISQPSISQQITQLETALRTPLFRRVGKRVFLTEAGAAFRKGAEVVLRKLEDACDSVANVADLISGRVDLAVIPALHFAWIPSLLGNIARDYPGILVGVQELASSGVETEVEAGRADLGFGLVTHNSPNIRYERLVSEPFSLIVADDTKFASRRAVKLEELEGERLVLLPVSFDMRRAAEAVLLHARVHPRVTFETDSIDTVLASVLHTGVPTLLPEIVLRGREMPGLKAVSISDKTRAIDFGILWPAANNVDPATKAIADALKHLIKSRSGRGATSKADR
ncbi:MAG TPA: LysR substrate-binding domain-containing protein [Steroidobacteraceae bacterium]|nr:LysR substrate-binding domain-containing protein [Steroidobacteraceae bacterium]